MFAITFRNPLRKCILCWALKEWRGSAVADFLRVFDIHLISTYYVWNVGLVFWWLMIGDEREKRNEIDLRAVWGRKCVYWWGLYRCLVHGVFDDVEGGRTNFVDFQFHICCRWGAESDSVTHGLDFPKSRWKLFGENEIMDWNRCQSLITNQTPISGETAHYYRITRLFVNVLVKFSASIWCLHTVCNLLLWSM